MLGLAALGFLGGWLNLAAIAYPPALWTLLAFGWTAAVRESWIHRSPLWRPRASAAELVQGGTIAVVALFLAITLLPGGAFNPGDDLQLYFYRAVRMLQAGTLGRDPFDPIGLDSLGVQSFLQAFTLLGFPLAFLNAFDAVLGMVLALALVAAISRMLNLSATAGLAALAALVCVNPQQVNISAVYSTTAFSLALVPATWQLLEDGAAQGRMPWRRAVPAGLLLAALAGLKLTNASLLVCAGAFLFLLVTMERDLRAALRATVPAGVWTTVFLLPWIALYADHYAAAIMAAGTAESFSVEHGVSVLLDNVPLHWGGTVLAYDIVAAVVVAAALAGVVRGTKQSIPLVALCGVAGTTYVISTIPFDIAHAVRYSAPVLLAGLAVAVLLAAHLRAVVVALCIPFAIALLFADTIRDRALKALDYRTTLAEPGDMREFAAYTAWSLGDGTQAWVRKAQAQTKAGERILALIACPHHLLFARNPVFVASEFGLTMPWLGVPLRADAAELRRFLRDRGIRYVIWQIGAGVKTDERLRLQLEGGYGEERRLAVYLLSFRESLAELTHSSHVVHRDDGLIVIDLAA